MAGEWAEAYTGPTVIQKSCKYCNEMFSENFMPNHVKLCQIYFRFMSKIDNSYNCKICLYKSSFKIEEWTRKAAISYLYSHIQNHHKKQLNPDQKGSNSGNDISVKKSVPDNVIEKSHKAQLHPVQNISKNDSEIEIKTIQLVETKVLYW